MKSSRSVLVVLALLLFGSPAFAQTALIFEISEGKYVGIVTTATGQQFALTNIVITKLRVVPDKPPVTPMRIDRVTYVYEKDNNIAPKPVAYALHRLNTEYENVIATQFEDDSTDGDDDIPDQYKIALEAAKKAGLPALVIQAGPTVVKVLKAPQTEAEVMNEVLRQ